MSGLSPCRAPLQSSSLPGLEFLDRLLQVSQHPPFDHNRNRLQHSFGLTQDIQKQAAYLQTQAFKMQESRTYSGVNPSREMKLNCQLVPPAVPLLYDISQSFMTDFPFMQKLNHSFI
ncbi:hypothetical protein CRENBAI_010844, partial [Crenichthys baileyi]